MNAVASLDVKRTFFECLWCHSLFDETHFSSSDIHRGPKCPVCGDPLERMEVNALGGTAEISSHCKDETIVGFWH